VIAVCDTNVDVDDMQKKVKEIVVLYRYAFEIKVISMESINADGMAAFSGKRTDEEDFNNNIPDSAGVDSGAGLFDPFGDFVAPATISSADNNNNHNSNSATGSSVAVGSGIGNSSIGLSGGDNLKYKNFPKGFDYRTCVLLNHIVRSHSDTTLATFLAIPSIMVNHQQHAAEIQQSLQNNQRSAVLESCLKAIDVITYGLPPCGIVIPTGQKMMQLTLAPEERVQAAADAGGDDMDQL